MLPCFFYTFLFRWRIYPHAFAAVGIPEGFTFFLMLPRPKLWTKCSCQQSTTDGKPNHHPSNYAGWNRNFYFCKFYWLINQSIEWLNAALEFSVKGISASIVFQTASSFGESFVFPYFGITQSRIKVFATFSQTHWTEKGKSFRICRIESVHNVEWTRPIKAINQSINFTGSFMT